MIFDFTISTFQTFTRIGNILCPSAYDHTPWHSWDQSKTSYFVCQTFCFTIHVSGFVSPFISQGLATMSQFEITLPSIRRRNVTEISTTTETSRMLHFIHQMSDEDTRVKVESMILTNTLWLWYKSTLQF